jgi:hypothetical protein
MVAGICCRYPIKIAKNLEYEKEKKKQQFFLLFLCFVCERFSILIRLRFFPFSSSTNGNVVGKALEAHTL